MKIEATHPFWRKGEHDPTQSVDAASARRVIEGVLASRHAKTTTSTSIGSGRTTTWRLPTQAELAANVQSTHGTSYDLIERKNITGHVAMLIEKVS